MTGMYIVGEPADGIEQLGRYDVFQSSKPGSFLPPATHRLTHQCPAITSVQIHNPCAFIGITANRTTTSHVISYPAAETFLRIA
jgi:hypothetical protein